MFLFESWDRLKHACYVEGKEPGESESWINEGHGAKSKILEAVGQDGPCKGASII